MDTAVKLAPAVGVAVLCAALGLSRATFYRRRLKSGDGSALTADAAPEASSIAPKPSESIGEGPSSPSATAPRLDDAIGALADSAAATATPHADDPTVLPVLVDEAPSSETLGGRSPVAAVCHGTQGATVPPVVPAEAALVDAARREAEALVDDVATVATTVSARVPVATKRRSPRAIPDEMRLRILGLLNEDRFCNLAPGEIYATLLDAGEYYCSERTMYRVLDENAQVRERRNQLRHPKYKPPELMAQRPNQLWTWDITKLKTMVKCQYLHLYVILDVFSRYVVGWMVADAESGESAKQLIDLTCERQGIRPGDLTFHADNGSAMVSQPVAFLLASLGITKSHSRPHVSDDNPYIEAHFKTLKYRPGFPERFTSIEHATAFLREFFAWYNTQHHHSGIALLTPHDVHHGLVDERLSQRARVLDAAYAAHPERFVNRAPKPATPPDTVWINQPKQPASSETAQA